LAWYASYEHAEQMAATEEGAHYVNITPWFCSNTCTAVIGKYEVFWDQGHITAAYAYFLAGVLTRALHLSVHGGILPPPTTSVGIPASGATVSGGQYLDASASPDVTSVRFEVTGGTLSDKVISGSTRTALGWLGGWNTTTLPNGIYTLRSVASYANGESGSSLGITIRVDN
jgi:hypothetical protein